MESFTQWLLKPVPGPVPVAPEASTRVHNGEGVVGGGRAGRIQLENCSPSVKLF